MPISQSVQNNFTKGLLTEYTGLNFPENAATDTDNCVYSIVGDVTRRRGFNYETNFHLNTIDRTNLAINTYKWNNVAGNGNTQLIVQQTGATLYFYTSSAATIASPLSNQKLASTVTISSFVASGGSYDSTVECQFADGNGYLFVYHPSCDPFYCTYNAGTITGTAITLQTRDFDGVFENVVFNARPVALTATHEYNIRNQGWGDKPTWSSLSTTSTTLTVASHTFTITTGLTITAGDVVALEGGSTTGGNHLFGNITGRGTVTSYNSGSGSLVLAISSSTDTTNAYTLWNIVSGNANDHITDFFFDLNSYPSNADQWQLFLSSTNIFAPLQTNMSVYTPNSKVPGGHYILTAFNMARSTTSAIAGLTAVSTTVRPSTGAWFQGRAWYTGANASFAASGTALDYTWTENIYFSPIVENVNQFGQCYQTNDPTSTDLFDLLPSDGGLIRIQGCGPIYKLFPIQNGMLVFAANGIWFITGNQGIGFTASDYTITKISSIQSISSTSFVDVNGLPYFWNEEGIYTVSPAQQGGLQVEPLTVGTILSFYNSIPRSAKSYVRGAYHPIDYVIQWIYKSTDYSSTTNRYDFDRVLNFNTYNKAFFPYSLPAVTGKPHVHGINYVAGPGGSTSPDPVFKYLTAASDGAGSYNFTFSEEKDTTYTDFVSYDAVGFNFTSYFVAGYRLAGKALLKFQPVYVYMYSNNLQPTQYRIQGFWDYANNGTSGKYSSLQKTIINGVQYVGVQYRKHKIRGRGMALQIKVTSVDGQPFDIVGWASWEMMNAGI